MKRIALVSRVLLLVAMSLTVASPVAAGAGPRPIEDFVDRQGKFCLNELDYLDPCPAPVFLFVPPVANFLGLSDPSEQLFAAVDYAGLADDFAGGIFGTQTTGSVTERALKDGRAEVHVRLSTTNALSWATVFGDFNGPLLFGHRAPDVLSGAEAALGESLLHVKFINTAPGAMLPDLIQLVFVPEPGQELIFISFVARANGPLADGTPGRMEVAQTGLFMTGFHGAVADGFPAENIILRAVGQ